MQVLCFTSDSQEEVYYIDMPQKNTFIHFDIHCEKASPPSSSAPGILLQRLFKTEAQSNTKICDVESLPEDKTPSDDNGFSSFDDSTTSDGDSENGTRLDIPHKHTFVHFDLHRELPPTPTASAPGKLLSRLFATNGNHSAKTAVEEPHMERLPSVDSVFSSLADRSTTCDSDFEIDPKENSSALESDKVSETNSVSIADCDADWQAKLEEVHRSGQCTPCNYFFYKVDGCRHGSKCEFCHLCPKGEIKKRKKDKLRQMRRENHWRSTQPIGVRRNPENQRWVA